jgi:hypothetical protein
MSLKPGILALAAKLQESADALSSGDISARLRDTIQDHFRGSQTWGYFIDYFGDGESGDVVYSDSSDTKRAPYSISGGEGTAAKCVIDFDKAEDVVPRTVYEVEQDEDDHYAAMESALKSEGAYTSLPLYERFVSKKERDEASAEDFAGKGKSFPILKREDVMAAARSIGRAGAGNKGPSAIKARIIAIAKRKGWTSELPKAWQTDDMKESDRRAREAKKKADCADCSGSGECQACNGTGYDAGVDADEAKRGGTADGLRLVESAGEFDAGLIRVSEASRTSYPIKLISPGTGSTAHYPAAVLERDGPKVFKKGTLMFWNHPTMAEESARPEGDLNNLAAIMTSDARWEANGPKGPGLYAEAKVMADYAQRVEERAPSIGLSIRAGGRSDGTTIDGKPVLKSLTYAESVDYVTKAGRGGLALAEAARNAGILSDERGDVDMTEAEVQKLVESAIKSATQPLRERALRGDATVIGYRILNGVDLPEVSKRRVIEACLKAIPGTDNALDEQKFGELVIAEARSEAAYLNQISGGRTVVGMGLPAATAAASQTNVREAEIASDKEEAAREYETFRSLGMSEAAARHAVERGGLKVVA